MTLYRHQLKYWYCSFKHWRCFFLIIKNCWLDFRKLWIYQVLPKCKLSKYSVNCYYHNQICHFHLLLSFSASVSLITMHRSVCTSNECLLSIDFLTPYRIDICSSSSSSSLVRLFFRRISWLRHIFAPTFVTCKVCVSYVCFDVFMISMQLSCKHHQESFKSHAHSLGCNPFSFA